MITFNIGLGLPDGVAQLEVADVLTALRASFYPHKPNWQLRESTTEPTVVAEIDIDTNGSDNYFAFIGRVYRLAVLLDQDCIAVSGHDAHPGELIGPYAASWGEFIPELFMTLEKHDD